MRPIPILVCAVLFLAGPCPCMVARGSAVAPDTRAIAVGDTLDYRVVESGEGSRRLSVSTSGDLEVPQLGGVPVAGKTAAQAAGQIKELLEKRAFFTATVLLSLVSAGEAPRSAPVAEMAPPVAKAAEAPAYKAPPQVTVIGRVRLQGAQDLPPDGRYYLSQAIVKAGGLTTWANGRKVQVVRKNVEGRSEKFVADVVCVLKEGQVEKDVELQPGDTIIVPEKLFNL